MIGKIITGIVLIIVAAYLRILCSPHDDYISHELEDKEQIQYIIKWLKEKENDGNKDG